MDQPLNRGIGATPGTPGTKIGGVQKGALTSFVLRFCGSASGGIPAVSETTLLVGSLRDSTSKGVVWAAGLCPVAALVLGAALCR